MAADGTEQPDLRESLDRLWVQYLPLMQERVGVLEAAAKTLEDGEIGDELRAAANTAAHNLAGVLGTFGLTRGTVLAREAEILYSGDPGTDPDDAAHLAGIAAQLKAMIDSRK
jgi:HPt (histidine-containing phosphotransfer) domain-containing protein